MPPKPPFILVVGHGPQLEREDGIASLIGQLGAPVRTLDLWDDFSSLFRGVEDEPVGVRAIVVEAGDRPDLGMTALRAARKQVELGQTPAILAVPARQVAVVEPSSGFDDFIVTPCVPAELYARIKALEWKRSEFTTEERLKVGGIVVDRAAHDVTLDGRRIILTAKEFALLAFLAANRGRVFTRDALLARVWGARYEGGPRTVDIHVRRLRAKLGDALPIETLRGSGYKLRVPPPMDAPAPELVSGRGGKVVGVSAPRLAISIGCPSGVGAEVSVVAATGAAIARKTRLLFVGDLALLRGEARRRGIDPARFVRVENAGQGFALRGSFGVLEPLGPLAARDRAPGAPTKRGGAAQLAWIDAACDSVRAGEADALVTGPASKEAIASSGSREARAFRGHTEHLQRRLGAREVVMAFWSKELLTALVTTHLSIAHVPRAITPAAVASAAYWLSDLLLRLEPIRCPVVGVAGLNPHAGEGGLLGSEEKTRIAPGIAKARARLAAEGKKVDLRGPIPAETAMRIALGKELDGVVAMYHDQATIPMKLTGFGEAVNVSLGLPIVRTSVDHGTAYDRAGKGIADARGMVQAVGLAARLARSH